MILLGCLLIVALVLTGFIMVRKHKDPEFYTDTHMMASLSISFAIMFAVLVLPLPPTNLPLSPMEQEIGLFIASAVLLYAIVSGIRLLMVPPKT